MTHRQETRRQAETSNPSAGEPFQVAVVAWRQQLAQAIVGQAALLDRPVIALLPGGQRLVEGLPGLAETTAVKAPAGAVPAGFQRIPFHSPPQPADRRLERLKWARLAQNQEVEGLNQLWEQRRGCYPSHAGQADTSRVWLEQQAETVPSVAKELNALPVRTVTQRDGPGQPRQ